MESRCAQIEAFQQEDSRQLHCDPVKKTRPVCYWDSHMLRSHHTPTDTFKARGERAKHGSSKGCTGLMEGWNKKNQVAGSDLSIRLDYY